MNAVILEKLSKIYPGGKTAVDTVSLSLAPGEVFGFLGPNGAGKTTTVKLLNGMLTPSSGSCRIFGIDPARTPEKAHAISGVVTEHAQMYDTLTGLENLIFYGSLFGLSAAASRKRGKDLLELLNLSEAAGQKLASYSTGMRQRLSLARAMIHTPQILFLDEPTSGLDPESAQQVHTLIQNLAEEKGVTIFLCTHQLRYAQEICTRYGLMSEGRLLAIGSLTELRAQTGSSLTVQLRAEAIPETFKKFRTEENCLEIPIPSEEAIPGLVRQAVSRGAQIYQVSARQPSLEDIYFTLTAKEKENS